MRATDASRQAHVLLVDGLDEANELLAPSLQSSIVFLLSRTVKQLPPWLKLFATSRNDVQVLSVLYEQNKPRALRLDVSNLKDNHDQIALLARTRILASPELQQQVDAIVLPGQTRKS